MRIRKLGRLVIRSIRRNTRDLALSSIGIVVGISTLLLFAALGNGIKSVVLEDVFVIRQLEVVPKSFDVGSGGGLLGGGDREPELTEETVDQLLELPGVAEAYPKMKLTFPSSIRGGEALLGQNIVAELVADGIPPENVSAETLPGDPEFRDWEAPPSCSSDGECPEGFECREGECRGAPCSKADRESEACPDPAYCDPSNDRCRMPIPIIASPRMLEIYNGSLRTSMSGSEQLGLLSNKKLTESDLVGLEFEAIFGRSFLGKSSQGRPLRRRVRFVGFSDRAVRLGATMPIGYVERLNREFRGDSSDRAYHSIVVETESNEAVSAVADRITNELDLALSDRYDQAQRVGLLITIITLVFNLISLIILAIAAVNIMHTFSMIVLERRREIGLMRAVGATSGDIRLLVLGESTAIGLLGGILGVAAGFGAIEGIDYLFQTRVADFPFKPASLFAAEPWMVAASICAALVFCWIGALLPATRASGIDPAAALSGR